MTVVLPFPARASVPGANLTFSIVEDLGVAIVTGEYGSDRPFPVESELCQRYNASRSVLREAVKMLTAKGLLAARPRQGTRVLPEHRWNHLDPDVLRWLLERKFSIRLLIEFLEMRLAVEPRAAALAAQIGSPTAKARIAAALDAMCAAESFSSEDSLAADIAFHVAILEGSENRFYADLRKLAEVAMRFSIRRTNDYKGVSRASVEDHRRVANAIMAGDAATAETAMKELIVEALDLCRAAQGGG